MYERFSAVLPSGVVNGIKRQLNYNGIEIGERKVAGFMLVYGISVAIATGVAGLALGQNPAIAGISAMLLFYLVVYAMLKMNSEAKGKFAEGVLPDALQLIASNMKSGLTTERALFVAGRPEFGLLQTELRNASKRISSGLPVEKALLGISDRINSTELRKTLWLICEGIKSGGQISDLLYQLADDLKNQQALQEEIGSNISIYIILILFASMVGAPLLFGVSSFVVQVISKQMSYTPKIDLSNVPAGNMGAIKSFTTGERSLVSNGFILFFSTVTILVTSLFACLTIGAINTGKEINGLKYVAPITIVALLVFFATRAAMVATMGGLA